MWSAQLLVEPVQGQRAPDLFDVRVNQTVTADQHEPSLAVNPTNPNNVLVAAKDWRTGPKQVWYYRSTDGGRTWADGHMNNIPLELPNQSDPVLSFDASGIAYLSTIAYNQNELTVGGIFLFRSSDGGATWQRPTLVAAHTDEVFNDKEWMAIDRSTNSLTRGNIYLTWTLFTSEGKEEGEDQERGEIVFSGSSDGGRTFSRPKIISREGQRGTQGSFPVVGPNGDIFVLYYSDEPSGQTDALFITRSTDGGNTFSPATRVAGAVTPKSPLPGSKFRIFILPSLAVDPKSGALYAVWNDYATGDLDVKLARSTDLGASWDVPRRVNDDVGRRSDQFFPAVVAGSDGAVHVLWLDRRDDPSNLKYLPYYARSTDQGVSFSRNVPLSRSQSSPNIGFEGVLIGDYISIDVAPDSSKVYGAWVDTRRGDQDIFFAGFDPRSLTGPSAPPTTPQPTPAAFPSPQPLTGFSEEAFRTKWERADKPVLKGKASRPWVWGPVSFGAAQEAYAQGENSLREVQYFDKARMEINNPAADPSNRFFVTNGLLVVELLSGRVQSGNNEFEPRRLPPEVPAAGDIASPDALTYRSLAGVASLSGDKRSTARVGQTVVAVLSRDGAARDDPARGSAVKVARYEAATGHNIPDVFWAFLNARGQVYNSRLGTYNEGEPLDWQVDVGYPVTEPYWSNVRVAGVQKWVLVQAFQRRVLTYVADNPPGWQVEMGNVGRHYFDWRYGTALQPGR